MIVARRAGAASATALACLVLTLGIAYAAAPEWSRRAGLDVWNLPSARADANKARDTAADLQANRERLFREIELTDHVAARLAAGDQTLADATDELEPVLGARPGFRVTCQTHFGTSTLREGVARYLMDKAGRALARDPEKKAAALARLEAEYARLSK